MTFAKTLASAAALILAAAAVAGPGRQPGGHLRPRRQVRPLVQPGLLRGRRALQDGDRHRLRGVRAADRRPARAGAAPLRRARAQPGDRRRLLLRLGDGDGRAGIPRHRASPSSTWWSSSRTCARWSSRSTRARYLVGVLAALASKTGKVGFVGGMDIPLIRKFACGYVQGVKATNPDAEVFQNMTGTTGAAWNDPVRAASSPRARSTAAPTWSTTRPAAPASACCRRRRTPASSASASTPTRTTCIPARC